MSGVNITGTIFAVLGVAFVWLAWLMSQERLPRNGLVGMRTRATMTNDAAWYAAHRASAWSIVFVGILMLAAGLWLLLMRTSADTVRVIVLGTCLAVLVVVVVGGLQADRVAKDINQGTDGAAGRHT